MTKEEAIKATKDGGVAACISAGLTTIILIIAIMAKGEGKLGFYSDPWIFLDVAIILVCAFGMFKKSRTAAVIAFAHYAACKFFMATDAQSGTGIGGSVIGAIIFLYYYGRAIKGAFVYHRIEKRENPQYRGAAVWLKIIGIAVVLIIVGLIGLGILAESGFTPSIEVQFGDKIREKDIASLVQNGIISSNDNITCFYSQGFTSILEGGNILTDNRVILYFTDENDQMQLYEIWLPEITDIELESKGDFLNDSVYVVNTADPEIWLKLFLSTEANGDEKFVKLLNEKIAGFKDEYGDIFNNKSDQSDPNII